MFVSKFLRCLIFVVSQSIEIRIISNFLLEMYV